MAFSVNINEQDVFPVITLKGDSSNCEAEVYAFGAILNAFSIIAAAGKANVIDGFISPKDAVENITNGFKSAKLSPFVCRMKKGEYRHEGNTHKIEKFYLGAEAIHGLLFDAPFVIQDHGADDKSAFVTLAYLYTKKEEGFPFNFSVEITFTLESNCMLILKTTVTNKGEKEMPLSDGWHPYFKLGETVNNLKVQFNSNTMVEFNDSLLPSGNYIPYNSFETMQAFGDTFLDNCFVLKNHNAASCILKDETTRLQLTINAAASYPYLQVYTPPHRNSIAVENLSSAPDAFNNGIGLIMAKPGESYNFITSYQLGLI